MIARTVEKTNLRLDEIAAELETDRQGAQLAARLPELIRGNFYDD